MKSSRLALAAVIAAGSVVATATGAHARADVQIRVTADTDYSACASIRRTNGRAVSGSLSARGYLHQGLATAQINDAKSGFNSAGSLLLCTAGAFTAENGEVTYSVTFTAGATTGSFLVQCVTVEYRMVCTEDSVTLPDPI